LGGAATAEAGRRLGNAATLALAMLRTAFAESMSVAADMKDVVASCTALRI